MPKRRKQRVPRKRRTQFKYSRVEGFDPLRPIYKVSLRTTGQDLGKYRRIAAGNYVVQRPQDEVFHSPAGSRQEAAKWLKVYQNDPAVFDDEED
jgi:hypothetical protein